MANDAAKDAIVYVIDDDESARSSLEFLLDVAGIRVRSFASGDAFLEVIPATDWCLCHYRCSDARHWRRRTD